MWKCGEICWNFRSRTPFPFCTCAAADAPCWMLRKNVKRYSRSESAKQNDTAKQCTSDGVHTVHSSGLFASCSSFFNKASPTLRWQMTANVGAHFISNAGGWCCTGILVLFCVDLLWSCPAQGTKVTTFCFWLVNGSLHASTRNYPMDQNWIQIWPVRFWSCNSMQ